MFRFVLYLRHKLYDYGILKSERAAIPTIVVGSIQMGGSGKTPFVIYLAEVLRHTHRLAILSRGYGRKTKGFLEVSALGTALEFGDEPLMIKKRIRQRVFVGENRLKAIEKIKKIDPDIDLIILDDGLQHRALKPDLCILLTPAILPYWKDRYFPFGGLRDLKSRAKRADIQIVAKNFELINIPSGSFKTEEHIKTNLEKGQSIDLLTGIASDQYLRLLVEKSFKIDHHFCFKDHHNYRRADLDLILKKSRNIILTTQKDWVKIDQIATSEEKKRFEIVDYEMILENEANFLALIKDYCFNFVPR